MVHHCIEGKKNTFVDANLLKTKHVKKHVCTINKRLKQVSRDFYDLFNCFYTYKY